MVAMPATMTPASHPPLLAPVFNRKLLLFPQMAHSSLFPVAALLKVPVWQLKDRKTIIPLLRVRTDYLNGNSSIFVK